MPPDPVPLHVGPWWPQGQGPQVHAQVQRVPPVINLGQNPMMARQMRAVASAASASRGAPSRMDPRKAMSMAKDTIIDNLPYVARGTEGLEIPADVRNRLRSLVMQAEARMNAALRMGRNPYPLFTAAEMAEIYRATI